MANRNSSKKRSFPEIKGGQKVIKSSPEFAGLDDRTTLDNSRAKKGQQ
ncbi:hypothetical protein [Neobacillus terrae]|nr:hypothetical protein [Neobacillus terrae]NHM32523.1 hypothetical protein [Neobacillus terrae]